MAGFQSTHPLRGATAAGKFLPSERIISIHAPLAGCDSGCDRGHVHFPISIHAPLAGCDRGSGSRAPTITISIHAPLAGCDAFRFCSCCASGNFNPRTPCGVRLADACLTKDELEFQSTHPLRGATSSRCRSACRRRISIHAPLAGCDALSRLRSSAAIDFNPRTPCGVRLRRATTFTSTQEFQSTHPLRGATAKLPKYSRQICEKATKFLQSQTKSGVAACWAKGRRLLFPTLRGANLPGKTGTLPVRIR